MARHVSESEFNIFVVEAQLPHNIRCGAMIDRVAADFFRSPARLQRCSLRFRRRGLPGAQIIGDETGE
jgi:hypothetical protein